MKPLEAASQFIYTRYPHCHGALLAGSVVRGEATATSDLDVIIFDMNIQSSFRESIVFNKWPIEMFVHNLTSYRQFFESDAKRAIPSHQQMVAEGVVIVDHGVIPSIKAEAIQMLKTGPAPWTEETIHKKRYFITDLLDDFIGSNVRGEELFIANSLANHIQRFVLRTNGKWLGSSKWVVRMLKQFDEAFAEKFIHAFDHFYKTGEKEKVIQLVDEVLEPYGGRLFHGFSLGK
ncbi:nucleotidyltransferase domain-containing protein [Evansella sp. AB-P1]|uniref:nucleotidyltransferase domain-containing protein n=1 Tax=Evansella sp. AB-P1 TaxID=3037653 RepID=UPI00241C99EC|nr:nucleotidyltransferase domain-containing protein [Evansella sp. AB-P1]MDG5789825.1 nucleotidyltransferase domain-containing protein [Evansella sp. AB-P1]